MQLIMDSPKSSTILTRTRSKTTSTSESTAGNSDAEMAPNLNGSKDGDNDSETSTTKEVEECASEKGSEHGKESPERASRKRKLSETKTDEEEAKEPNEKNNDEPVAEGSNNDSEPEVASAEESQNPDLPENSTLLDTSLTSLPDETANMSSTSANINDSISNDLKTINTGMETYGKGKRARVPNKRYSDISRAVSRTPKHESSRAAPKTPSASSRNGEFPDDDLGEILREESELEAQKEIAKRTLSAKKPSKLDLSSPALRKPFKYGWRRELVIRATATDGKRNGDIYYYSPSGKKLRSMREVSDYIVKNKDLSLENFTYFKEPLGINDHTKEIIRDAKRPGGQITPQSKKISQKMLIKAKKRPRSLTPPAQTPKGKSGKTPSFKVKPPIKGTTPKKEKKETANLEMATVAPNWTFIKKSKSKKPCRPCSIRCEGVLGLVPTLQCRICLCLYHNECVGIAPQVNIPGYICKNCQLEQEPDNNGTKISTGTIETPESSTPISTAPHSETSNSQQTGPTDLNQNREQLGIKSNTSDLSPKGKLNYANTGQEQKSLVGSVTSWFPPSSTIKVGNNDSDSFDNIPRRPQLVEYIGNKKYIVVPRHNILSVNPNFAAKKSNEANEAPAHLVPDPPASPADILEQTSVSSEEQKALESGLETEDAQKANDDDPDDRKLGASPSHSVKSPSKVSSSATTRAKETKQQVPRIGPPNFMNMYLQNLQYGYTTLFYVFQYLKVQDLLRAGCVCSMWRDLSRHPALWRTVRMKNSQIHSFEGMANALKKHGTDHLDLRKMLLPSNANNDDIWPTFTNAIKKVETLRRIELCRCLASVVEDLARNNHNLEVINAVTIKCESMNFEPFANLVNLVDLRIKSTAGLTLTSDLSALKSLTKLKHLSITSIKDLNTLNIEVISELENLEVLDLGECTNFPRHFGSDILSKLTKLEKLRLEKGQGECYTFDILEAVKDLENLQQLELVNFDIKAGFDKSLGACSNIKKLLIIPTYISQSATTNHMVLGGVLRLQKTLSHFVWGVTLELLRVTELFVDQCEQPDKKEPKDKSASADSIPVLKPVPLHGIQQPSSESGATDTPQVEILPLPNLQKLLLQNLPQTRVKILKIPFHATWRQNIIDSVN